MTVETKKTLDTLSIGVYSIYDCVLKQFEPPFSCSVQSLNDYMSLMVNDVQSRFYKKESDYILNKIGDFDQFSGEINLHLIERVSILDSYIDNNKRKLQTIIQTLNFMPQGYYKMPEDRKKEIQEKIDLAIKEYVENYVVPDIDLNKEKDSLSSSNKEI